MGGFGDDDKRCVSSGDPTGFGDARSPDYGISAARVPGAEAAAPASLDTKLMRAGVRFTLMAPWTSQFRSVTTFLIEQKGLTITAPVSEWFLPWEEIGICVFVPREQWACLSIYGRAAELLVAVPCTGTWDDAWLVAYLQAHRDRHRSTEQEREQIEQSRSELESLLGKGREEAD